MLNQKVFSLLRRPPISDKLKNARNLPSQAEIQAFARNYKKCSLIETIKQNNQSEFDSLLKLKTDSTGKKFIDEVDAEDEGTPLWWAVDCGFLNFIDPLIKAGTAVNKPNKNGSMPIYIAAYHGHTTAIAALIAAGANVNTPRNGGYTPIWIAAANGHAPAIAALHAAGASVDTPANDGVTPIYAAVESRHPAAITALLEAGATACSTALELAKVLKFTEIVNLLDEHLIAMNLIEAIKQNNQKEFTELLDIIKRKSLPLRENIVNKVDFECKGSPLYWAAALGYAHFIIPLLKAEADINKQDKDGITPVYKAVARGHVEAVAALLKAKKADINTPYNNGYPPISAAAYYGHTEVIRKLIASGASINTRNRGFTPVYLAAEMGHASAIATLNVLGADVNIPDSDGKTPLYIAVEKGHIEAVVALLDMGADPNRKPQFGTVLECARLGKKEKHTAIVSILEWHFKEYRQYHGIKRSLKISPGELQEFLRLVAAGEQDEAEAMLNRNRDLALGHGDVTDLSKRTFTNITGFQYAVWALDWHMWTMIRKYLSDENARFQAEVFKTGPWVENNGIHFNLNTLIQTYETMVYLYKDSESNGDKVWVQGVGGIQRLFPAHIVNEYCHPTRPFCPIPNFKDPSSLPRSRTIVGGEWFTAQYKGGRLGDNFAVYRGGWEKGEPKTTVGLWSLVATNGEDDLKSVRELALTRENQREQLIVELRDSIILDFYKIALEGDSVKLRAFISRVDVNQGIKFDISQPEMEDNSSHLSQIEVPPPDYRKHFGKYMITVGETALHAASKGGHAACVQLLLKHGAKIIPNIYGETPLYCAAEYDHLECAKLLLEAGDSQYRQTNLADTAGDMAGDDYTPFDMALRYGAAKVMFVMLASRGQAAFVKIFEQGPLNKLIDKFSEVDKKYFDAIGKISLPFKGKTLSPVLCSQIEKISKYMIIEELHFSRCKINDDLIRDFLNPLLEKLPNLEKLSLTENQITYRGARYLASALKKYSSFKSIDLSNNYIDCVQKSLDTLNEEFHQFLETVVIEQNFIQIEKSSTQEHKSTSELFYQYKKFQTKPKLTQSLLDKSFNINQEDWVVSLMCMKGTEHAMIYMEGMDSYGQRFFERYHIQSRHVVGSAEVVVEKVNLESFDSAKYLQKSKKIGNIDGLILKDSIKERERIDFLKFAPDSVPGDVRFNCLTWCLKKLKDVGIHMDGNLFGLPSAAFKN
jgi:ankyrin repeat protein